MSVVALRKSYSVAKSKGYWGEIVHRMDIKKIHDRKSKLGIMDCKYNEIIYWGPELDEFFRQS
jgi:hypothetical protein